MSPPNHSLPGPAPSMTPIDVYLRDYRMLPNSSFRTRNPHPVLLYRAQDLGNSGGFRTSHVGSLGAHLSSAELLEHSTPRLVPTGLYVVPITKRPGAIFSAQISVGRTRNTDLWLPEPKVSKFHAYFVIDQKGEQTLLHDAGSTNGTFVNHQRLQKDEPELLLDGAVVRFGSASCVFYSPDGFCKSIANNRLPLRG